MADSIADSLKRFITQLTLLTRDSSTLALMYIAHGFCSKAASSDNPELLDIPFKKWIKSKAREIEKRDEKVFSIQTDVVYMKPVLGSISSLWPSVNSSNKNAILLWMDHFVVLCRD